MTDHIDSGPSIGARIIWALVGAVIGGLLGLIITVIELQWLDVPAYVFGITAAVGAICFAIWGDVAWEYTKQFASWLWWWS